MNRQLLRYTRKLAIQGPSRWYGVDANIQYGDHMRCKCELVDGEYRITEIVNVRQFRFPRSKKFRIMKKWRKRNENWKPSEEMDAARDKYYNVRLAA